MSERIDVMNSEYTKGEQVRFTPEWADGDNAIFVIVAEDEGKGRVTISPLEWDNGPIVPTEVVQTYMIERI